MCATGLLEVNVTHSFAAPLASITNRIFTNPPRFFRRACTLQALLVFHRAKSWRKANRAQVLQVPVVDLRFLTLHGTEVNLLGTGKADAG